MHRKKIDEPVKFYQWLFLIILFTGMTLLVVEIDLYQCTFIDLYIPLTIWIITGILVTPLLPRLYHKNGIKAKLLLQIMCNILSWGSITLYSFMAINYYLANTDYKYKTLPIISRGRLGSKGKYTPYIIINFEGKEKQLTDMGDVSDEYHSVKLKLAKGYFGYVVVKEQTLIR